MKRGHFLPVVLLMLAVAIATSPAFSATFYSRASGNWTSASTWSTVGCGGTAATGIPGTTDDVVICSGHTVTTNFTSNTTILNLTISTGATLTYGTGNDLLCRSLVIDGTINGSGNCLIRMAGVAGNTLSGTGSVASTGANSGIRIRRNATVLPGTDITFSNSARFDLTRRILTNNGIIRFTGNSFVSGNTTGLANFVNATSASFLYYNVPSSFPTNVILTATAPGNTVVFGATSGGPHTLDVQGSYHHLVIQGAAVKRLNPATVNIAGTLTVASGSILDANGGKTINIQGDWDNDNGGSFTESTSIVVFNSTTANQTIYPPAGANGETFYSLTINNTSGGGTVTANGNITLTSGATLTMTAGIFNTGANTLSQVSGAANFTATGGDLRLGKLSTALPELAGTYNITGGTITFNGAGSQTIRSLVTAPGQYHHLVLGGSGTKTLAGDIWVNGDWTNGGVSLAGNFTATFGGPGDQTISKPSGESFYRLTVNKTGLLIMAAGTDVTVTNGLTMTAGDVNLNGQILTIGSGSGATLTRTAGKAFGGTWRRYFPSGTAITSGNGSFYGLFPIGTSLEYRPIEINSTANATTGGYVLATHIDGNTTSDVSYVDNEGATIQRITNMRSTLSTQTLAGGTYSLNVTYTSLSTAGSTTNLKLETLAGSPQGVGTSAATLGTTSSPVARRTGLSVAQLNHDFVLGTTNKSTTPMKSTYYSRKSGAWNDNTGGAGTWSETDGGPSCDCVPPSSSDAVINSGHVVTIANAATADFITVRAGGMLNGTNNLVLNFDLTVEGNGQLNPSSGSWAIGRNLNLTGASASSGGASFTVGGDLVVAASNSLTLSAPLTVSGNMSVNGAVDIGASTLTLNGASRTISGATTIAGSGTIVITGNKTTTAATALTFNPAVTISAGTTLTNNGTITLAGHLNGANGTTSVWTNAAGSTLNIQGNFLSTGVLNASANNTVNYNGSGSQTIKAPATSYYNLGIANAGTKTLGGNTSVSNQLTIQGAATLDAGTNSLSGTAGLTMAGTSQLLLGETTAGTYPALTGSYSLPSGTVVLNQTPGGATAYTIRGVTYNNLQLSGAGAAAYTFAASATIANDLTVSFGGTSSFANSNAELTIGNTFTFNSTSATTTTLSNGLSAGTFVLASGAFADGANIIELTGPGGWIRNGGTYTSSGAGEVYFTSDQEQQIGGSVPTTFRRIEMENSSATGVRLNQPTVVTNQLILTDGKIITTGVNYLQLNNASSGPGSEDSFVEGPMRKVGSGDFVFPVGKNSKWARIGISGLSGSLTFQAEYFDDGFGNYSIATAIPQAIKRVSSLEYWQLDRISPSGSASVTLFWESAAQSQIDNCDDLAIAKGNGSSQWEDTSFSSFSGSCSGAGSITSQPISTFSPFTFGTVEAASNPLPIKLLSLKATTENNKIVVRWETAQEKNNNFFTVEKSGDGIHFTEIDELPGAGNSSSVLAYESVDRSPYAGINYYRLKQTDFDGKFEYFGPVSATLGNQKTIGVYPNPTRELISWKSPEQVLIIKLFDNTGRLHSTFPVKHGESEISLGSLPTGLYHVQLITPTAIYNSKVTKE